ncbi:MAG: TetR/AcrR family transcriptional regulator [Pseudomonadota bacterium]
MARPRAFDKDAVIAVIKNVFWEKGFEGTSYTDLIAASGLHKGSLYQAFGDKRALYLRALADYDAMEVEAGVSLLINPDNGNAVERIEALLEAVITAVRNHKDRRGCFLCNAAIDQAPVDPGTEEIVTLGLGRMHHAIEMALSEVDPSRQHKNRIPSRSAPAAKNTASQIMACYFGMRVMAKAGVPLSMLEQARDAIIIQLKG